jgi:hypothetical protein
MQLNNIHMYSHTHTTRLSTSPLIDVIKKSLAIMANRKLSQNSFFTNDSFIGDVDRFIYAFLLSGS